MAKAQEHMRQDWDERARQNAFRYIASWRESWDEASFFESGEQDYLRLVQPYLQQLQVSPATQSIAELGCGAGRMTRSFANRFLAVVAVDVSPEMQSRAKAHLQSFTNIRWVLSDGKSLAAIESESLDFAFSYLVLQHMPNKDLALSSIAEMMRILRPGGKFLFQFNGYFRPTMNWKGRALSKVLDGASSSGFKRLSQSVAKMAGIDPGMLGRTWRGAALKTEEVTQVVRSAQACPYGFSQAETPLAWCYGRKQGLPDSQ
jgi:ubiquinone/menaquinone biosynthesis C-methylase UbiE